MNRVKQHNIKVKRSYDDDAPEDGIRLLVDKLWPRGRTRESLHIAGWFKNLAPSNELRESYHQGAMDYPEFCEKYRAALAENPATKDFLSLVKAYLAGQDVTLLFSSKNQAENNATALKDYIQDQLGIYG